MRQALTQQRPGGIALPDSVGSFNRRKRNSLYVTVTLLIVSVLILTVGLAATTRTQNVTVGGYYPGVISSSSLTQLEELKQRARGRVPYLGCLHCHPDHWYLHSYFCEHLSGASMGNSITCGWLTDVGLGSPDYKSDAQQAGVIIRKMFFKTSQL